MVYIKTTGFEFDERKSTNNKTKHGIDFVKAQELWNSPHFEFPLRSEGETRWGVIGTIEGVFWTAVITKRDSNVRIISMRRSRNEEKQAYQNRFKTDRE